MKIAEFGKELEKTFMLLPGTCCTWEINFDLPGTAIHVFHSEKMGGKYLKRYRRHYAAPDIIPLDYGHEGWLGNPTLMIETFDRCMNGGRK